ncbi:MAG: hypothetical protein ACOCXH_05845 [Cyclobacteriaceae bacterium]
MVLVQAFAQHRISPYTTIGVGDVTGMSLIHNDAMAGAGIATSRPWNMSTINPAWLPTNELTTFEIGMRAGQRTLQQDTASQTFGGANLGYMALSFPLKAGRVSTSIGLMPYSNVDYEINSVTPVQNSNDFATTTYRGYGGINQAFIATGVRFFKHLYVGARLGYLFSAINEDVIVNPFNFQVNDTTSGTFYKSVYTSQTGFGDLYLSTGIAYEFKIGKKSFFNLGATYDLGTKVNAERTTSLQRRTDRQIDDSSVEETIDYGEPQNTEGSIFLPAKYGLGIAFQRGTKWNVAADAVFQDWNQFMDYNGEAGENLGLMSRYAIGVEFIPDFFSVRSYWDRVSYKAGLSFGETPFVKNNQQIQEIGINFGGSLPIGGSVFSLVFGYGQRGTTDNNLVFENYYNVSLGVSFNDRWFQQRKYD